IHVGSRPPLNLGKQARAVRCDLVSLVEPANQFRAPVQQPDGVVPAERQPIEGVGVAARAVWRGHRFPVAVTVPVPGAAEGFDGAVFGFQPLAKLGLGGWAIAFLNSPFVPHVVAQSGGLSAISLHQSGQEFPGLAQDIVIIQTKGRAWGYLSHIHSGAPLMISAITVLMWFWPSSSTIRS